MKNPRKAFDMDNVAEELADVLMFAYYLASLLGVDIDGRLEEKMEKLRMRFGVEKL